MPVHSRFAAKLQKLMKARHGECVRCLGQEVDKPFWLLVTKLALCCDSFFPQGLEYSIVPEIQGPAPDHSCVKRLIEKEGQGNKFKLCVPRRIAIDCQQLLSEFP